MNDFWNSDETRYAYTIQCQSWGPADYGRMIWKISIREAKGINPGRFVIYASPEYATQEEAETQIQNLGFTEKR